MSRKGNGTVAMIDVDTGVAEARTLHPQSDGWFAIFRKNVGGAAATLTRTYQLGSLEAVVRALDKAPDAYLSQASFVRASRRVANFKSINCAFVDIDCYSGAHNSPVVVPDDAFIERLHEHARAAGIPTPSYTTLSGRGVYCKWVFDKPLAAHQLIRWKALQAVLVPLYAAFGVDSKAKDAARVLRVMGSAHADTGSIVRVGSNTGEVHNFDALCAAAAVVDVAKFAPCPTTTRSPNSSKAFAKVKSVRAGSDLHELNQDTAGDLAVLRVYSSAREPILAGGSRSATSLHWSRFCDLRTLAEYRGGILPGSRDIMMFWMATSLAHAGVVTSENLESEVTEMLGAFSGPGFDPIGDGCMMSLAERLKEKEAGRVVHFKGGSYDPVYTPTNDHLIDVLGITAEEQTRLVTIIGGEEKLRRADAKVEGRAERRDHRIEWRGLARQMEAQALAAGETRFIARIARELQVDARQVSRLLAGKLDRDPARVETRGRKKQCAENCLGDRLVIERHGGLSRVIRLSHSHGQEPVQAAAAIAEIVSRPAICTDPEHARLRLPQFDLGDRQCNLPLFPASFNPDLVNDLAAAFPHRVKSGNWSKPVIFSLSRKKREEEGALALKAKSEVFQAGGLLAPTKDQPNATTAPRTAATWDGWAELAAIGKARTGITGKRQANQPAIKSEGWVRFKTADGTFRSKPLIPIASIVKAAQSAAPASTPKPTVSKIKKPKQPTPAYMDPKTGRVVDFVLMRAEGERILKEREAAKEAHRLREAALDAAARAQVGLQASNRLKEIRDRAMAKATNSEVPDVHTDLKDDQPKTVD